MSKIKRALISVSDKTGVIEFAQVLDSFGIEILSTGGTAKSLRDAGVKVKDVSEHTGFPEMMGGRIKTLHPKIHGGILGRRDNESDMGDMLRHGIEPIDLVVVNLYPFEQTASKEGVSFGEVIENIDIGGPTMLRSAAKNFQDVAVVVDPADYKHVTEEIRNLGLEISYQTKSRLARKVFSHTARYDTMIADYLAGVVEKENTEFPAALTVSMKLHGALRYGENPHQRAAMYIEKTQGLNIFNAKVLQGREMSFNNYLDVHSGAMLMREFSGRSACAIIKHNNPCGVAAGDSAVDAYVKAQKSDPVSSFGGIVVFNAMVDKDAAEEIIKLFVEVVVAPDFSKDSLEILSSKRDLRVISMPDMRKPVTGWDMKRVCGGMLVQEWDLKDIDFRSLKAVTKRSPTSEEMDALEFAWRVSKHVKSNSIIYARKDRTVGIGIGQTSRVYAARVGAINAIESLNGTVVASDGFFPFRDAVDSIHKVGVTAVVQPGGSLRDAEVIAAADEHNMAMILTGARHFKH